MVREGFVHKHAGVERIPAQSKKGAYVKLPTVGVSSVVLKGNGLRDYTLSVPDHRREGAYWIHCRRLTRLDLETVVQAIQSALREDG